METNFTVKPLMRKRLQAATRASLSLLLLVMLKLQAFAQPVTITLTPSSSTVQVGANFTVSVVADFTAPGTLSAIDAYLNFNPLDLEFISATVDPGTATTALPFNQQPFESAAQTNAVGMVKYGRSTVGAIGTHPNADFTFYTVTFKALRVPPGGIANMTFNTTLPFQTLAVEGASIVSGPSIGGTASISLCTPPSATIGASAACGGAPFDVVLNAATGTGPFTLVVNGTTYPGLNVNDHFITGVTQASSTLFPTGTPPLQNVDIDNGGPVELGMKFSSNITGFVKGVRFYNGGQTAGTFTGSLWSYNGVTGSVLATATFTSVTTNDWQQVLFSNPVLIAANTTYIISYRTPQYYSRTTNYFYSPTAPVVNGPLTAPEQVGATNTLATSNGVLFNPATDSYFTNGFFGTNYWVDLVFQPNVSNFDLTSVADATCLATGAPLQTLTVTEGPCGVLPVTLQNLSATPNGNKIVVKWTTSSEQDNKGFDVERSVTGNSNDWHKIGFVAGSGSTTIAHDYSYTDADLSANRYFYRLKQIDIDNHFKYSATVSAVIDGKGSYSLEQNFPNPFRRETTTIRFSLPHADNVNLTVFDLNGRLIKVLVNGSKDAGTHIVTFDAGSLGSGVYYYKLQTGGFSSVKKMTIQ